jgi:SagB-type dehydrogenase family enzyme
MSPRPPLVLSPFASVRLGEEIVVENPIDGSELRTDDARVVDALLAFRSAGARGARARVPAHVVSALARMGVLVPPGEVLPWWEPHDLQFHFHTCEAEVSRGRRRVPRHPELIPPALRPDNRPTHALPPPRPPPGRLADVLVRRRSHRDFSPRPLPVAKLSSLLGYTLRNTAHDGHFLRRTYPSGGAAHSLEGYLALRAGAVTGLEGGVYRYCPEAHALQRLGSAASDALPFLSAARAALTGSRRAPPGLVLLLTSRFARASLDYDATAYTTLLKELGCLYQTVYLVATALGLRACALGGGRRTAYLARLNGSDLWTEPLVGQMALGAPFTG